MGECDHFWRTIEESGYGWVSVCELCGVRKSAEHSDAKEFEKVECESGGVTE